MTTDDMIISTSPHDPTDEVVSVRDAGARGIADAVERARAALPAWGVSAFERSTALLRCADALQAAADELVGLVVREVGKPLTEARGEVARAVAIIRYAAQDALLPSGEIYPPSAPGTWLQTHQRPRGVAGLITPWNFPVAIPLWKAAPALAHGCTVVLKPAPQSTAVGLRLAELFDGLLPPGVLQLVPGGAAAGTALAELADIVSFTGSSPVGALVRRVATEHGAPVQCEMGGSNASLVLADADLDLAARTIAGAAMGYAGQKCTATSRVVVVGDQARADDFAERLADAVGALAVGDPAEAATVVGPVVDQAAADAVVAAASAAAAGGAAVVTGGSVVDRAGAYVSPTVVTRLAADDRLLHDEVFGPICAVVPADSTDAAVRVANGVRQGLAAAVFTRDLTAAMSAVRQLDAGMIKVNAPTSGVDFHAPFGGSKASSHGPREQGPAARAFYTETVTVTVSPG